VSQRTDLRSEASVEGWVERSTGARAVTLGERVQTLWSGYGEVRRARLELATGASSVIVKLVTPPAGLDRSGAQGRSHRRKMRSYEVEQSFYESFAKLCSERCRVPAPLHLAAEQGRTLFVLEDLDAAGFGVRKSRVSATELEACLRWLAAFHATFLGVRPGSLWKVGTYWHLATRPDELEVLGGELRRRAGQIDERLNRAPLQTFVHGDAKLQNFCFARDGEAVAAVDFQYVGGGVGVKDVIYLLTSCRSSGELEREADGYLDDYFRALRRELQGAERTRAIDVAGLEAQWRALYPFACADFYRFFSGWAPAEARRENYLKRVTESVLKLL
jgi:hypothetical protein